jgi:hypothetical protein
VHGERQAPLVESRREVAGHSISGSTPSELTLSKILSVDVAVFGQPSTMNVEAEAERIQMRHRWSDVGYGIDIGQLTTLWVRPREAMRNGVPAVRCTEKHGCAAGKGSRPGVGGNTWGGMQCAQ